jgi:Ser/Thr protein kinase RdoA (MazF antagonist)
MMTLRLMQAVCETVSEQWESPLAEELVQLWTHDPVRPKFWRASTNFVFFFKRFGQDHVLRFNHEGERVAEQIEAELDYVIVLADAGVRVAKPVRSIAGHRVERINTALGLFHAVVFEGLPGKQHDLEALSPAQLERWGQTLGELHNVAARFTKSGRPSWREQLAMASQVLPAEEEAAHQSLRRITDELGQLSITAENFGLIHYDFELDNLIWDGDGPGIIDFDDCAWWWFGADINLRAKHNLKQLSATHAYFLRNGFDAFNSGLIFTALYVYYARTLGLTPLQLSMVGALHMLAHIVFEIPTGVVADVVSRKQSVLIGSGFIGLGFVLTGSVPLFAALLIATTIEAIGDTFISGALDAWLTDEVGADKVGGMILRAEQIGTPIHWAGVGASVLLATLFNHQVPIVLGGALWLVAAVVLMRLMPETGFVPRASVQTKLHTTLSIWSLHNSLQLMRTTFVDGIRLVRAQHTLLMLFAAQLLIGAFDSSFFALNQLHLFTGFALPVFSLPHIGPLDESIWIALINAANSLLYWVGIAALRRKTNLSDAQSAPQILFGLFAGVGVGAVAFALAPGFAVAALALCLLNTLNTLTEPLLRAWLNQHIPSNKSEVRATVISMSTQVNRVGMMGGNLSIGALGDAAGLRIALSASVVFLVPLMALLRRSVK